MTKLSDIKAPAMSLRRQNDRQLAPLYTIHGVLVGGVLFVVMAISSQAARTTVDGCMGLAAALVQPVPMFIAAAALWHGWRSARLLSLCLPLLIVLFCLPRLEVLLGLSVPRYRNPLAIFGDLQMMNIPGATVFAIVTVYNMLWEPE
jgi:hypothetical protein